jgi:hypothetical protein
VHPPDAKRRERDRQAADGLVGVKLDDSEVRQRLQRVREGSALIAVGILGWLAARFLLVPPGSGGG